MTDVPNEGPDQGSPPRDAEEKLGNQGEGRSEFSAADDQAVTEPSVLDELESDRPTDQDTEFERADIKAPDIAPTQALLGTIRARLAEHRIIAIVGRGEFPISAGKSVASTWPGGAELRMLRQNAPLLAGDLTAVYNEIAVSGGDQTVLFIADLDTNTPLWTLLRDGAARTRIADRVPPGNHLLIMVRDVQSDVSLDTACDEPWIVRVDWRAELIHRWGHRYRLSSKRMQEFTRLLANDNVRRVDDNRLFLKLSDFERQSLAPFGDSDAAFQEFERCLRELADAAGSTNLEKLRQQCFAAGKDRLLEQTALTIAGLMPDLEYNAFKVLGQLCLAGVKAYESDWTEETRTISADGAVSVVRPERRREVDAGTQWAATFDQVLARADIAINDHQGRRRVIFAWYSDATVLRTILSTKYPESVHRLADNLIAQGTLFAPALQVADSAPETRRTVARMLGECVLFDKVKYGAGLIVLLVDAAVAHLRGMIDRRSSFGECQDAANRLGAAIADLVHTVWDRADAQMRRTLQKRLDPAAGGHLADRMLRVAILLRLDRHTEIASVEGIRAVADRGNNDLYRFIRNALQQKLNVSSIRKLGTLRSIGGWLGLGHLGEEPPNSRLLANSLWAQALLVDPDYFRPYAVAAPGNVGHLLVQRGGEFPDALAMFHKVDWRLAHRTGLNGRSIYCMFVGICLRGWPGLRYETLDTVADLFEEPCVEQASKAFANVHLSREQVAEVQRNLSELADEVARLARTDPARAARAFDAALEDPEFAAGLAGHLALNERAKAEALDIIEWPFRQLHGLLLSEWCFQETGPDKDRSLSGDPAADRRLIGRFLDDVARAASPGELRTLCEQMASMARLLKAFARHVPAIRGNSTWPRGASAHDLAILLEAKAIKTDLLHASLLKRLRGLQ